MMRSLKRYNKKRVVVAEASEPKQRQVENSVSRHQDVDTPLEGECLTCTMDSFCHLHRPPISLNTVNNAKHTHILHKKKHSSQMCKNVLSIGSTQIMPSLLCNHIILSQLQVSNQEIDTPLGTFMYQASFDNCQPLAAV